MIVLVVASCGSDSAPRLPPEPAADAEVWAKIRGVAAAREPGTAGDADVALAAAITGKSTQLSNWKNVFQTAAEAQRGRSLDSEPEAAVVVERLRAWADRGGALPYRCTDRIEQQPLSELFMLAQVGIYAASPIEHGPLVAAVVLARRILLASCSMADALLGFKVLELARPRATAIGAPAAWPALTDADVVRQLAAETVARRQIAIDTSDPARRKEVEESLKIETQLLGGDPTMTVAKRIKMMAFLRDEQARIWRGLDATSPRAAVLAAYQSIDDQAAAQLFAKLDAYRATAP